MNNEMFTDNEKRSRIFRRVMDGFSLNAYREFIESSLLTAYPEEYEKHHIVPKCFGGSDHESNIVRLEPSDHLEAHRLLLEGVKRLTMPEFIKPMQMAYNMMKGRIEVVPHTKVGTDFLELFLGLDKAEQWLISELLTNFNRNTNVAKLGNTHLSSTEVKRKAKAYKTLEQKGFIKRVRNGEFMLNPDAIINPKNYEDNKKVWDKL